MWPRRSAACTSALRTSAPTRSSTSASPASTIRSATSRENRPSSTASWASTARAPGSRGAHDSASAAARLRWWGAPRRREKRSFRRWITPSTGSTGARAAASSSARGQPVELPGQDDQPRVVGLGPRIPPPAPPAPRSHSSLAPVGGREGGHRHDRLAEDAQGLPARHQQPDLARRPDPRGHSGPHPREGPLGSVQHHQHPRPRPQRLRHRRRARFGQIERSRDGRRHRTGAGLSGGPPRATCRRPTRPDPPAGTRSPCASCPLRGDRAA